MDGEREKERENHIQSKVELQWNLSIVDTTGPLKKRILIRGVSLSQRLIRVYSETVLIREASLRVVPLIVYLLSITLVMRACPLGSNTMSSDPFTGRKKKKVGRERNVIIIFPPVGFIYT